MKLFNTNNVDIIQNCQQYIDVKPPSSLIFELNVLTNFKKFAESTNSFCNITAYVRYRSLYCYVS